MSLEMNTRWTASAKIRFVFSYAWAKLRLVYDVRSPRWTFFVFELRYSLTNLVNSVRRGTLKQVNYSGPHEIATRFETFIVRPGTQDAAIVSPAFERDDLTHMTALGFARAADGAIDFVDIGANIGQFCVRLPLRWNALDVQSWAFEPVPQNLDLLQRNLARNAIRGVNVSSVALSDRDGRMHMSFDETHSGDSSLIATATAASIAVEVRRGDAALAALRPNSARLIKIDVEGHELAVLRGLPKTLSEGRSVDLCIEDIFHRDELYAELRARGFTLRAKLTPYNSWWSREAVEAVRAAA